MPRHAILLKWHLVQATARKTQPVKIWGHDLSFIREIGIYVAIHKYMILA